MNELQREERRVHDDQNDTCSLPVAPAWKQPVHTERPPSFARIRTLMQLKWHRYLSLPKEIEEDVDQASTEEVKAKDNEA